MVLVQGEGEIKGKLIYLCMLTNILHFSLISTKMCNLYFHYVDSRKVQITEKQYACCVLLFFVCVQIYLIHQVKKKKQQSSLRAFHFCFYKVLHRLSLLKVQKQYSNSCAIRMAWWLTRDLIRKNSHLLCATANETLSFNRELQRSADVNNRG